MIVPRVVTKLVRPGRSRLFLHRARLVDFLNEHIHQKLILLSAPAGYGKTSLLIDFAHSTSLPVCWYSLDDSDGDPKVFLDYFIASVRRRFPHIGEQAQNILANSDASCGLDAVVGALVTEIQEGVHDHFVIVLDDYDTVAESDAINHLVDIFLAYLPEQVHVVISSRTLPSGLKLHRLTARQELAGLGVPELEFTPDEIHTLLLQNHQIELSPQETHKLAARSEGWIAGVLLTSPALWPGLCQRLVQAQNGHEQLFRFLAGEALTHLPPDLQRFLMDSAVFNRMDTALCDELLGTSNAAAYFHAIEERNLFIVRFNGDAGRSRYRYHPLFHEFLRQRLSETDPDRWRDLNRRAAELCEKRGSDLSYAIGHYAAAGMHDDTARVIEIIAQSTFDSGHWTCLADWIDTLPQEVLGGHPSLIVMRGILFAETGKNAEAEQAYAHALEIYQARGDKLAEAKVLVWRAMLWRQVGRYREAIEACESVLGVLHKSEARVEEARAYRTMGVACAHLGKYPGCIKLLEKALQLYEELGDPVRVAWLHHEIGTSLRFHDDPNADQHFRQALDFWRRTHNLVGLATTLNNVGVGHHRAGDYTQAIETLEEARDLAHQTGNRRNEAAALASLGDVYRDQGEHSRALQLYQEALELSGSLNGFVLTYVLLALGEAYRLSGNERESQAYLARALDTARSHHSDYERGLAETAMAIWQYQQGQFKAAGRRLHRAIQLLNTTPRDQARGRLHLAQAYLLQRKYREARRQLEAIVEQKLALVPTAIPFIRADRNQLQPVLQFAASEEIGEGYYAPLLEKLGIQTDTSRVPPSEKISVYIRALGSADVRLGDPSGSVLKWRAKNVKELLFLLVANPAGLREEQVAEAMWTNEMAQSAANSYHTAKSRLRHMIPSSVVLEEGIYRLGEGIEVHSDAVEFEQLIRSVQKATDDASRAHALEGAIELYRGEYYEECYQDWCAKIRGRLRQMYLDALVALAELRTREGNLDAAMALYQKFVEKDPDSEPVYQAIMRIQLQTGDYAGVARTYEQCAQVLREHLGVPEPSPETKRLYGLIKKGGDTPAEGK